MQDFQDTIFVRDLPRIPPRRTRSRRTLSKLLTWAAAFVVAILASLVW